MLIKKYADGNYYLCRRSKGSSNRTGGSRRRRFRNIYLIPYNGHISVFTIVFPKELVGKRVRLKVMPVED